MSALNPGSKVFKLVLRRDDPSQSWGFRLQGGKDFPMPVSVAMVNPGGLADQNGMSAQDAVLQINGINTHELDHEQAKYEIVKAGNEVTFLLQRGAVTVWRPQVTKLSDLKGPGGAMPPGYDETFVQKTSLAANKPEPVRIGSAHNRSARPFPGFGGGSAQPAAPQPVSAPAAAPQPPPQQYQPPPQQQYQPPPQQQFQPPPQQYSPQPQQYGGQPPQSYGQPPQQQQFNQPPQQYNQPPQQYNQPPQQYNPPPQQYNQAPPPSQYQPSQYGQSQPSPYGQSQPSQPSPPNYPPPNAQSQFPGGPPIDDGVGGKGLVHAQYNSPMGMYSNENIVNTFQAHANVLAQDLNKMSVSADDEVCQINSGQSEAPSGVQNGAQNGEQVSNGVSAQNGNQEIHQEVHRSTIVVPSQRSTITVPGRPTIQVPSGRPTIQVGPGSSSMQVSGERSTIQVPSRSTIQIPSLKKPALATKPALASKPNLAPKPQMERRPSPILLAAIQDDDSAKAKRDSDDEFTFKGHSNPHKQSRTFKLLEAGLSSSDDRQVIASVGGPAAVQQQGYRSVSAPAAKPPGEIQQQQPQQLMTCKGCGGLCTGVFIRIKGAPIHAECFKCVKCGVHLKNIGYFEVEGRFYCETHAKQVAQPPEPGMVAVPTYQ